MKKMVYTVSDLTESSIECLDLMYKSLLIKNDQNDFDFYVLTNNKDCNLNVHQNWNIIYDECSSVYVGWLKYSTKIPKDYDLYYYFDSDILCYESLDNLVDDCEFSFVIQFNKMSEKWFCYPLATEDEKIKFSNVDAFNAGTFVLKDLSFLDEVRHHCKKFDFSNPWSVNHAIFEQASFNYNIFIKNSGLRFKNLRDLIELYPDKTPSEKKIYHFCGFNTDGMYKKSLLMRYFDSKYRGKIISEYLSKML